MANPKKKLAASSGGRANGGKGKGAKGKGGASAGKDNALDPSISMS